MGKESMHMGFVFLFLYFLLGVHHVIQLCKSVEWVISMIMYLPEECLAHKEFYFALL